jgi:hypothetical protein
MTKQVEFSLHDIERVQGLERQCAAALLCKMARQMTEAVALNGRFVGLLRSQLCLQLALFDDAGLQLCLEADSKLQRSNQIDLLPHLCGAEAFPDALQFRTIVRSDTLGEDFKALL